MSRRGTCAGRPFNRTRSSRRRQAARGFGVARRALAATPTARRLPCGHRPVQGGIVCRVGEQGVGFERHGYHKTKMVISRCESMLARYSGPDAHADRGQPVDAPP